MLKQIIKDENVYENGKRINTQHIVTSYGKADDIILLSQDIQTLGHLEASVERLTERLKNASDSGEQRGIETEITRIQGDIAIMREKIKMQQGYVDAYEQ